ncbi:DUF2721 domain-containing protein [Methylocystis sp.]|uniref:DUF2721 domain-containing protein n=1 Tax=Methylocystis sp. TaxID=1911079 RepID=UPI003D0E5828
MYYSPSIEQLSTVISQVTGPAFLLAAEAQLLDVLISRLDRIVDRSREIDAEDDQVQPRLKAELPVLKTRAKLIHRAIYWGVGSCIATSVLVILGFGAAFLHVRHEYGAGFLFAVAMILFTAALIVFARELQLGFLEIEGNVNARRKRERKSYPHV